MLGLWQDQRSVQQLQPQEALQRQMQQQQQLREMQQQQQQRVLLEQRLAQQAEGSGPTLPAWAQAQGDRQAQLRQLLQEQQLQQLQQQRQRQQLADAQARLAGQQQPDAALQALAQAGPQAAYSPWAQFPGQQQQQWDLERSLQAAAAQAPPVPPQQGVGRKCRMVPLLCAVVIDASPGLP